MSAELQALLEWLLLLPLIVCWCFTNHFLQRIADRMDEIAEQSKHSKESV